MERLLLRLGFQVVRQKGSQSLPTLIGVVLVCIGVMLTEIMRARQKQARQIATL
jgi:hypothetical protein